MKQSIPLILLFLAGRFAAGSIVVGDWPFDRTADGVAVTDGQTVLEENTSGLFDASGNWAMGQARHYAGASPPGPSAAAVYARWKTTAGKDQCALDTSCGGVHFLDGSPKLRAVTNFSVWTRCQPLNADLTNHEVLLGRMGGWLICREKGRLAAGLAEREPWTNCIGIRDVFAGNGPILETGRWYDIGFSIAGDLSAGCKIRVYLDGVLVKDAMEKSFAESSAPFQIGGEGLEAGFPGSKFLFERVVVWEGVLDEEDFARLSRTGGPRISNPAVVVEPLMPSFWWSGEREIGHASAYRRLKWNPKLEIYCVGGSDYPFAGQSSDLSQKIQRKLFEPVLAPQEGHFGTNSAGPNGIACYSIASYFIPPGYSRQSRCLIGAIHLLAGESEEAPGAKLELRVYVNNNLKLTQTIAAQKEAVTFSAKVGRLEAGDRVYVAFGAASLGEKGEFSFDYKMDLRPSGEAPLLATCPVADAFRVDTTTPLEENTVWTARNYQLCAVAGIKKIDLLFVGDSVTAGWDGSGKEVWNKQVQRYRPGNFGIAGEGTQDVLWRITHRELDGLDPKVVVVLLGSNDINWPAAEIAGGVAEVVRQIRARLPNSQVFLMGILPRGEQPNTLERARALEANGRLEKLDDGRRVHYFYFGDKLLLPDGRMSREIAPDFLHPSERGYQIWMEAIQPGLDKVFGIAGAWQPP